MNDLRISRIIGTVIGTPGLQRYTQNQVRRMAGCKLRHSAQDPGSSAIIRECGVCVRAWIDDGGNVWAEFDVEMADDRLGIAVEAVAVNIDGSLLGTPP